MDSGGHSVLERNGVAFHPATHPDTALVVVTVAVVRSVSKREDHNGRGPLGPTCGHHFGLPVSPATTPQPNFSAGAGVQGSARFPGTGAGGISSVH